MNRILLALALTTALIAPAFAEGMAKEVSCKDYMAMGHDDMMAATTTAMSSDAMAADGAMATDATKTATPKTGDAMAANGAMSADDQMAAMVKACTAHPDMMAMDAMHMMQ
jgi:hypothetical protein